MKSKFLFGFAAIALSLAGCTVHESKKAIPNSPPFQFPFGQELNGFERTALDEGGEGDCWGTIIEYKKENSVVMVDSAQCSEYSRRNQNYLLRNDSLLGYHSKEIAVLENPQGKNRYVMTEKTYDFQFNIQHLRVDTIASMDFKLADAAFSAGFIEDAEAEKTQILKGKHAGISALSFTKESIFKLSTKNVGIDPATGLEMVEILVDAAPMKGAVSITKALSFKDLSGKKPANVPADAVFAFDTWYAGGGYVFHGLLKGGLLQVWRRFEGEESTPGSAPLELFLEIDPAVPVSSPDHYICFNSDDKKSKRLSIAFDERDKALFAKYEGGRHIGLKHQKDEHNGGSSVSMYAEMMQGTETGTYKITHSGIWDYVEYTPKNGKGVHKFTIDHGATIVQDAYRKLPCF